MTQTAAEAIDANRQGLIGKDVDRVDGPLKVAGKAPYAYEYDIPKAAYGHIVNATIAKGRIVSIDDAAAKAVPGVALVMTHLNAPKLKGDKMTVEKKFTDPKPYLFSDHIQFYGQPVALVVAETPEAARAAANLLHVDYARDPVTAFRVEPNKHKGTKVEGGMQPADSIIGDFETAYKDAPIKLDATYTTPFQNHNAIELHNSIAEWDKDGKLTLHTANQLTVEAQTAIAATFDLPKEKCRIVSRYIGGGFGGKLPVLCDAVLAAMAAKMLERPVKVAMTRQQVFANATHRTESVQQVRLAAKDDGTLTGIAHECFLETSHVDEYLENAAAQTRALYAAPNRITTHRLVHLDLPPNGSMRAPGEAIGMLALEQAMDELADKLNLDPIDLRIRNEPAEDPEKKQPFSSRKLVECMKDGAEKFGWSKRQAKPGQTREGEWLIGMGMSAAFRTNLMQKSQAKVSIDATGKLTGKMAMTDPGTGMYTVATQIAAETMGLPVSAVDIKMGDTDFPPTPGAGGSWGANSAGSGLLLACQALQDKMIRAAVADNASPLYGKDGTKAVFENGNLTIDGASESLAAIAGRDAGKMIEADATSEPPETYKKLTQAGYGAFFAEVAVNQYTGEVRLRRMLGAFAAGRILNAKTARSQALGGMIWGLGSALHEESVVDSRWGQFVNHDLAEYHIPVHADAANVEAYFLPEVDDKTGPLKIKGVGELGICGAGASVANAIYNACGARVREYPITLDKILKVMPAVRAA